MLQRSSYRILREVVLILLMKYWSEIIRSQDEFVFFHFKYLFYSGNLHYNILSKITTIPPINLKILLLFHRHPLPLGIKKSPRTGSWALIKGLSGSGMLHYLFIGGKSFLFCRCACSASFPGAGVAAFHF